MNKIAGLAIGLTVLAAACTSSNTSDPGPDPSPATTPGGTSTPDTVVLDLDSGQLELVSALRGFDECEAVLDHIHTEASLRVGAYGVEGDGRYWFGTADRLESPAETEAANDLAVDDAADSAPASTVGGAEDGGGDAPVEGQDFSGTNTQETGVDEPDIVKTDGRRIFVVSGSSMVVVDAASGEEIGRVGIGEGWRREMFLSGDDVLIISQSDTEQLAASDVVAGGAVADGIRQDWQPVTLIQRVSVGAGAPVVVDTLVADGDYVSARAVDGTARLVLRSDPVWHLPFVYPQSPAGEERAAEANREIVSETTIEDWLPSFTRVDGAGAESGGLLVPCQSVHAPTTFAGFGSLTVLSVPVDGALDPSNATSVLAPGNLVYASPESLFVATQTWFDTWLFETEDDWQNAFEQRQTSIHRFDLGGPAAVYSASGSVPGDVRNQFSFSEYDGHLRVVTTSGETWDESSESFVRVLREIDGDLVEVGSVGNLGNGEAVQSVRFVGDMGYVVTFRQVDPFYTVDLSDPTAPRVAGELKIPGFSSYLHPLGGGLVLGVGSTADEETGRVTGAKVSLFDASDPADPAEIAVWEAPDGWNDVGWEHRAFLWWAPEQLAVIPVQLWSEGWAGAVVLRVADGAITEVGRVDHDLDVAAPEPTCSEITSESLGLTIDEQDIQSEIEWLLVDRSSRLFSCGPGETAEPDGFSCNPEPWFREEADRVGIALPDGDLVVCWPGADLQPIVRSFVIGDELFTLSYEWDEAGQIAHIHGHDLATLTRLFAVEL